MHNQVAIPKDTCLPSKDSNLKVSPVYPIYHGVKSWDEAFSENDFLCCVEEGLKIKTHNEQTWQTKFQSQTKNKGCFIILSVIITWEKDQATVGKKEGLDLGTGG